MNINKIKNFNKFITKNNILKISKKLEIQSKLYGTSRYLFHSDEKKKFHIMLICHNQNHQLDPFKNKFFKEKIFILIRGKAEFEFYDIKGNLKKKLLFEKKNDIIILNENSYFYRQLILSKNILFFEITSGPYLKKNNLYLKNLNKNFPSFAVKKNILYLTNKNKARSNQITKYIESKKDKVFIYYKKELSNIIKKKNIHFIVSDRYTYKISKNIINKFKNKIINLHHSFLPYGKGWNPIFWSVHDKAPYGCSIHYVNYKIDCGNIISQKRIFYNNKTTLKQLYKKTRKEIFYLFRKEWEKILKLKIITKKNNSKIGNTHFKKEDKYIKLILKKKGWNTSVSEILRNISRVNNNVNKY